MSFRADLWFLWFINYFVKILMKPVILLINIRRKKNIPPMRNILLFHSAKQLAQMIRSRKVTCEEVVKAYIARVREVNPLLNAVVEDRFEASLLEAKYVDRVIQSGSKTETELEAETPLFGVPFTVKESIAVKGMSNAAGQVQFEGRRAQEDADVVKLMKAAGAIPILVSNTPEQCMFVETYNKVTGTTNNPYDLRRTPSGSSGGEAALISAGASVIGLGSDIAGSLRIPAAFTGIFSHKPTPGTISVKGHNPTSPDENWYRYFSVGPLSRYAEDLPLLIRILSDNNRENLRIDEKVNVKDIKFFYMEDNGGGTETDSVNPEIKRALQKVVAHLKNTHGITAKKVQIKEFRRSMDVSGPVIIQLNDVTNVYQNDGHPKPWSTILWEFLKFYTCLSKCTYPPLLYALLKRLSLWLPDSKIQKLRDRNAILRKEFYEMLGDNGVFLYPTFVETAYFHLETYYKTYNTTYTMIMNALEVPVTTCPIALDKNGLPIGIQVVGAPYQDRLTIAVAQELENAFGGWSEPPSTESSAKTYPTD